MVMGIVICMAKRESVNIHSVSTTSNPMASVSNTAIKRKNAVTTDAQTMPSGMAFASVMVQSAIAQSLVVPCRCIRHRSADITSGVFRWRKLNLTQQWRKFWQHRQQQKQSLVCVVMHQLRPQVVLSADKNFIPSVMTPPSWTLLI